MNENHLERLLTVAEVAEYLRLSKAQVYAMIARKEIPAIRISERRIVVSENDLVRWVQKQKSNDPSQLVFMIDNLLDE
jgi:excisionase family DNA binding protein